MGLFKPKKPKDWDKWEAQARDFQAKTIQWFYENLKIIDRQNKLVPFSVYPEQADILYWIGMQLAAGAPPRIQILKARRMGVSTLAAALATMLTRSLPNYSAFACAHDANGTSTLSGIARRFINPQNMPDAERLPLDTDSREAVVYAPPHSSSFRFHTAGSDSKIGRSQEITFLHISEKAHIENWQEVAKALMACVPDNNPLSMIIEETTANGASGPFYDDWTYWVGYRKKHPWSLDGKICLFFSWLPFPDYKRSVPDDYDFGHFDEREQRLLKVGKEYGGPATPEHLYWRRMKIATDYSGDEDSFAQEYPAYPQEAFIASGAQVIPHSTIEYHRSLEKPGQRFVLEWDHEGKVVAAEGDYRANYWEVWETPQKGMGYAVGGDVATGKEIDETKREPDAHAAFVLNRVQNWQSARWQGPNISETDFGRELLKCATWYNNAWSSPEVNNTGKAALLVLKEAGYQHLYRRQGTPESLKEGQERGDFGWMTTSANRDFMIDTYLEATRRNLDGRFDGRLKVFSKELVDQEESFVRKKSGKREHQDGEHDDEMFAAFIALQLNRNCPSHIDTEDRFPHEIIGPRFRKCHFLGGVDDRDVVYDDEDDETG